MASTPRPQVKDMPAIHALQLDDEDRPAWINYSALDAKATWELHAVLRLHLKEKNASGWPLAALVAHSKYRTAWRGRLVAK
jgi:hypothetical protein